MSPHEHVSYHQAALHVSQHHCRVLSITLISINRPTDERKKREEKSLGKEDKKNPLATEHERKLISPVFFASYPSPKRWNMKHDDGNCVKRINQSYVAPGKKENVVIEIKILNGLNFKSTLTLSFTVILNHILRFRLSFCTFSVTLGNHTFPHFSRLWH